jgi:hypothetical protein
MTSRRWSPITTGLIDPYVDLRRWKVDVAILRVVDPAASAVRVVRCAKLGGGALDVRIDAGDEDDYGEENEQNEADHVSRLSFFL